MLISNHKDVFFNRNANDNLNATSKGFNKYFLLNQRDGYFFALF